MTEFTYNEKTYIADYNRVKFSQVLNLQAKLGSGLVLKIDDQTKDTSMIMSEEYAQKEGSVIVELMKTIYAIDFDLDELDVELCLNLYQAIKESPFFTRLGAKKVKN
jgi:hypothetical protein